MAASTPDPAPVDLLVLDVDGVLTDGRIVLDGSGRETKQFHVRDGFAMRRWQQRGGALAIITGRSSDAVAARAAELDIEHVFQGVSDKAAVIEEIMRELGRDASRAAAMGDDWPDVPMLERVGYPMTVADAPEEIRAKCAFVTQRCGGDAAVREAIEHLLRGRGEWP